MPIVAIGIVGVTLVDVGRVKFIEQFGMAIVEIAVEVVVPHQADAARAPSTTVICPSAILWLAARWIGVAGAPQVLFEGAGAIHKDVMCGFIELSCVACVVGRATALSTAPVVARGDEFQLGCYCAWREFVIYFRDRLLVEVVAEVVDAKPNGLDVGVKIFRRTFLQFKD